MESLPFRSTPRALSNLAHTCSVPSPSSSSDISFSSEHNQFMEMPSYHLLSANDDGAVNHNIYSNDQPPMVSHIGSSNTPFISSEISDWDLTSSIPDLSDFPLDIPIQSNQLEEEDEIIHRQSDLAKLDEELLTDDENPLLSVLWNDLFYDTSAASKVQEPTIRSQIQQPPQVVLHQTSPAVRTVSSDSFNTAAAAKGRVRWTPELHEAFVEAVNLLGGMEKAKPKAVLKHMKVQGLTIYHVKSHLQKYRTARHVPEPSEGSPDTKLTPLEHVTSLDTKSGMYITEALRIQMEVQKQLHEQLEIQRKMQLQIEKQGKALLMMIEKQNLGFGKPEQEVSAEDADSRRSKRPRMDE